MEWTKKANQLFAFFLKQNGVSIEMVKTNYGYRTKNSLWKIFVDKKIITKTSYSKEFNGSEYLNVIEESIYQIVSTPTKTSIKYLLTKRLI